MKEMFWLAWNALGPQHCTSSEQVSIKVDWPACGQIISAPDLLPNVKGSSACAPRQAHTCQYWLLFYLDLNHL